MKDYYLILISIVILFTNSCEYKLKEENIVEINPPDAIPQISLELVDQSDTIHIFTTTSVNYNFNTSGLEVILVKFSLANKTWELRSNAGSINISPASFTEGYHTLTAEIFIHSGTGSIGDLSGTEGYYATRTWMVRIGGEKAPELEMFYRILDEGYLLIEWEKCNLPNFVSYKIRLPDLSEHIICDPDSNYFVDKNYVCGEKKYFLECEVISSSGHISYNELIVNEEIPDLLFEEKNLDSLRLYWSPPKCRCVYFLEEVCYGYDTLLNNVADTSITIVYPGFSKPRYNFVIRPEDDKSMLSYACFTSKIYQVEKFADFGYPDELAYEYNRTEGVLYACSYDSIVSFDNLNKRISAVSLEGEGSEIKSYISCSRDAGGISVLFNNTVYIFEDKYLNNPVEIKLDSTFNNINYTDNNIILTRFVNRYDIIDKIKIIDPATSETVLDHYFDHYGLIKTSKNGNYVAYISDDSNIYMYEVQNDILVLKYSFYSFGTEKLEFNDNDPHMFYFKEYTSNIIELRNCEDNTRVSAIDLTTTPHTINNIIIHNTDPISGCLFISISGKDYAILDMYEETVKFKIKSDFYVHAKLFDSKIYTEEREMLNIISYLDK